MSFTHSAFDPYRDLLDALALSHALPIPPGRCLDELNALAECRQTAQSTGLPVRFFIPDGRLAAREYETHILQTGQVPTRPDTWHDILNALVWLRFPRFKAALNAAHGAAIAVETETQRGRRRDALTVLDESGVWVLSQEAALCELLVRREWKTLFLDHRRTVQTSMRFVVVGHALLEKALTPYPSMTGKCLMLLSDQINVASADEAAARELDTIATPQQLPPLPIQGVPDWDKNNDNESYYANETIFRPARLAQEPSGKILSAGPLT